MIVHRHVRTHLLPFLFLASLLMVACGESIEEGTRPAPPPLKEKEWKSLVDGKAVLERTRRICALGPRTPGSKGAKAVRAEIEKQLRQAGFEWSQLKRQSFTAKTPDPDATPDPNDKTDATFENETRFVNLIAILPGKRKEGIAIAAHYDSKIMDEPFVGANDAASAVAGVIEVAAGLAREAKDQPRENSIYFIFFDGEESFRDQWQDPDNRYGSRHFAEEMKTKGDAFEFPITGLILLDMIGSRNIVLADDGNSDPALRQIFKQRALELFGVPLFRKPPGDVIVDDHVSFKGTPVRVIDLIDVHFTPTSYDDENYKEPWWHTRNDTLEILDARSLEKVLTLVLTALPEVEELCNR